MKVVFHKDFYQVYTSDPAAEAGRMEAILEVIGSDVAFVTPEPASEAQIAAAHTKTHVDYVRENDPYYLARLALDISKAFSRFYKNVIIREIQDESVRNAKLMLVTGVRDLLGLILSILGIAAPQEM